VAVMYAGIVVEHGPTDAVMQHPRHPYTQALLEAGPTIRGRDRLVGIPGAPASPDAWPKGCRFAPRCRHADRLCEDSDPVPESVGSRHFVACRRVHELARSDRTEVQA
jgi:oligopeptide/dipeptide ABC transporter ATP-binding protein